jgi:hypothetical protein
VFLGFKYPIVKIKQHIQQDLILIPFQ